MKLIKRFWTFIKILFGKKLVDKKGYIDTDVLIYKIDKANKKLTTK